MRPHCVVAASAPRYSYYQYALLRCSAAPSTGTTWPPNLSPPRRRAHLFSPNYFPCHALDVFAGWDRRFLEGQAVRHRHLRAAQAPDRGVEVVEAPLLDAGRDLSCDAVRRPTFFDHHAACGAIHRFDNRHPVDGADRSQVEDLGVDVLLLELLGSLV